MALGCLLVSAPASADDVRQSVEAGNRAFVAAFLRGDATAVADLYTENAQVIAPGAPIATGRAAIAAFWQSSIASGIKDVTLETTEVESDGSLACETGVISRGGCAAVGTIEPATSGFECAADADCAP